MKKIYFSLLAFAAVLLSFVSCGEEESTGSGYVPNYDDPVYTVYAESVVVSETKIALLVGGGTYQLSAEVFPDSVTDSSVTWFVDSGDATVVASTIAKVDSTGLVTALSNTGQIEVRAASSSKMGVYGKCTLEVVNDLYVTQITMSTAGKELATGENIEIYQGEVDTIALNFYPWYTNTREVIWSSNNPSNVSVDQNGIITAYGSPESSQSNVATITATSTAVNSVSVSVRVNIVEYPIAAPVVDETSTEIGLNKALIFWEKEDASALVMKYNFYVDGYSDPVVIEKADAFIGGIIPGTALAYSTNCAIVDFSQIPSFDTDFETQDINVSMSFTNNLGTESDKCSEFAVAGVLGDRFSESLGHAMVSGVEDNLVAGGAGFYSMTWTVPSYCTGIDLTYTNTGFAETTTEYSFATTSFIMISDATSGAFSYTTNYEFGFSSIFGVEYTYKSTDAEVESGEVEVGDYIYVDRVVVTGGTGSFQ